MRTFIAVSLLLGYLVILIYALSDVVHDVFDAWPDDREQS
jgi:hypothetical protein